MANEATTVTLPNAGYSATPLPKKLGLVDGQHVAFIALPEALSALTEAAEFADMVSVDGGEDFAPKHGPVDLIHFFTKSRAELSAELPRLVEAIQDAGAIWVSWPKKASKVATDVTEDVIRDLAIEIGLVDVKVCAVDATWSGLKLMIPRARRAAAGEKLTRRTATG